MNKTIYVAIPSLPDGELIPTINNIYSSAEHPERVYVGLVCFGMNSIDKFRINRTVSKYKNISTKFIDIPSGDLMEGRLSVLGISNGRHQAMSMYDNQDYVLQIDSHSLFCQSWDTKLIDLHSRAIQDTKNEKTVLTGYASSYQYSNGNREFVESGFGYPTFMENQFFFDFIPKWGTAQSLDTDKSFIPVRKFNANFAFSDKSFANTKSLPDNLVFFEEEILQTIELLKQGFALCFPVIDSPIIGHLYTDYIKDKKHSRKYVMDYSKNGDLRNSKDFHNIVRSNYFGYIEQNKEFAKRYEKYAKVNLKFGPISSDVVIPESYEI